MIKHDQLKYIDIKVIKLCEHSIYRPNIDINYIYFLAKILKSKVILFLWLI